MLKRFLGLGLIDVSQRGPGMYVDHHNGELQVCVRYLCETLHL